MTEDAEKEINRLKSRVRQLELEQEEYDGVGFVNFVKGMKGELGSLTKQLSQEVQRRQEAEKEADEYKIEAKYALKREKDKAAELVETRINLKQKREKLSQVLAENRRLKEENEELKGKIRKQERPTEDELRAMKTLEVTLKQLRGWAKAGVGPQPPYDDPEELIAWIPWVESRSRR